MKGLHDKIKIGNFEILFYDNEHQLAHYQEVGDMFVVKDKPGLENIIDRLENKIFTDLPTPFMATEWQKHKYTILYELTRLHQMPDNFIFRFTYNKSPWKK